MPLQDGDIVKIYVLWGGQYDVREMVLLNYKGKWWFEDNTGGHKDFTTEMCPTIRVAKVALAKDVFSIGEPTSFIDFGEDGIWRDWDPSAWFLAMSDPGYERFGAPLYIDK